jgi:hypothetical protein
MMKERIILTSIVISAAFLFASTHSLQAGLTNGDFPTDLTGWTIAGRVEQGPWPWPWPNGSANGSARLAPDEEEGFLHSTLSQVFKMDAGSQTLSFDLTMETGGGETDVFTAYLLNPITSSPLISIVGKDYFFSLSSDGDIEDELVSVTGDTIWLDVSGLATGSDVKIVFDLAHDYGDGVDTYAFLDNVNVSLTPAPCAFVLGSIGVGFVAWLRRRRTL